MSESKANWSQWVIEFAGFMDGKGGMWRLFLCEWRIVNGLVDMIVLRDRKWIEFLVTACVYDGGMKGMIENKVLIGWNNLDYRGSTLCGEGFQPRKTS